VSKKKRKPGRPEKAQPRTKSTSFATTAEVLEKLEPFKKAFDYNSPSSIKHEGTVRELATPLVWSTVLFKLAISHEALKDNLSRLEESESVDGEQYKKTKAAFNDLRYGIEPLLDHSGVIVKNTAIAAKGTKEQQDKWGKIVIHLSNVVRDSLVKKCSEPDD
jgi:hypothetical protein